MNYSRLVAVFLLAASFVNCIRAEYATRSASNSTVLRYKRYLDFIPKTRMFFRANVKANILSGNQLLVFGYGYRANYPIENDIKVRRRDVYDSIEELIDHQGFNGRTCVLKMLCDASNEVSSETGMFRRLYQLIFKLPQLNRAAYSGFGLDDCDKVSKTCPLQLANLSPYTDM